MRWLIYINCFDSRNDNEVLFFKQKKVFQILKCLIVIFPLSDNRKSKVRSDGSRMNSNTVEPR